MAGASAYPRLIDYERFSEVARRAGALFLVDMAHVAGLVAAQWRDNKNAFNKGDARAKGKKRGHVKHSSRFGHATPLYGKLR